MKQASGPEKINIEENSVGINFKKSEQVKKHLNNSSYPWKDEISSGPVINDILVIYVDFKKTKRHNRTGVSKNNQQYRKKAWIFGEFYTC